MPRRKKPDERTETERARDRLERAKRYVSTISDDFIKKANAGKLSQEQFTEAAKALRAIVTDSHLTGIRNSSPRISLESISGNDIVVKISISTSKTRKSFSIRRRF